MKRRHGLIPLVCSTIVLACGCVLKAQTRLPAVPQFVPRPVASAAQRWRAGKPGEPLESGLIHLEAEEFQIVRPGWQARDYGENYYVSTFAVTFLSRKAFLAAPPRSTDAVAEMRFRVPRAGNYFVLVRYEAPYRFHAHFRVEVEQAGRVKLRRLYGSSEQLRIWPFGKGLAEDLTWPWGANEQIVWEGHDVRVPLDAGLATIRLIAVDQADPAAARHVDCVVLTTNEAEIRQRLEKERYLPLDGLLTQSGDVWAAIENHTRDPLQVTLPPCVEHSPYWVHLRRWTPRTIVVRPGRKSDWIEIGSLLDCFNDSLWHPRFRSAGGGDVDYTLTIGTRDAAGDVQEVFRYRGNDAELSLYLDGAMRYHAGVMHARDALPQLLEYLRQRAAREKLPQSRSESVPIFALTFQAAKGDTARQRLVQQWLDLFPLAPTDMSRPGTAQQPRGYIDVRRIPTPKLEGYCRKMKQSGLADRVLVVSLGDEIALPAVTGDRDAAFRQWLQRQGIEPQEVQPQAQDWQAVRLAPAADSKQEPRRYYWSHRFLQDYGIEAIKERTDILRRYFPRAGIGANYSPHHGYHYLGEVHKWVDVFQREGMTLPWSEDYIWQTPVASQQVNSLGLDLFRAGLRGKSDQRILYYVMPHWPGNTPQSWRRLFYAALGHGMKIANLFEFRPLPAAYTENYVNAPATYWEVLKTARELGTFDDIVATGSIPRGDVGLWFSRTADIWRDYEPPFAAEKRTLYVALRYLQLPVEIVTEREAEQGKLDAFRVIYVTDRHMSRKAAQALLSWVRAGGTLFLSCAAAARDEYDAPLDTLYRMGVHATPSELGDVASPPIRFVKEDLPFADPVAQVVWRTGSSRKQPEIAKPFDVFGVRARLSPTDDMRLLAEFLDGAPAFGWRPEGRGRIFYCSFLPALAAVRPSIERVPVTRGGSMDSPSHSSPTRWQPEALRVLRAPVENLERSVRAEPGYVETCWIESPHGTALVLIGWCEHPVDARIRVRRQVPSTRVATASGRPVRVDRKDDGSIELQLRVEWADAVIFASR